LRTLGWSVLIVWECETKDVTVLRGRLQRFLETPDKNVKHGKR
jgi:G:T-mismatch repair DNA endonuclease (very short patch repair protein)